MRLVREYLRSCGIALLGVALLGGIASVPNLSAVSIPLAPGMLLAAIIFPQGGESEHAFVYVAVAVILDVLLYGWLVLWLARVVDRRRHEAAPHR